MAVEAETLAVRNRWLFLLRGLRNGAGGQRHLEGRLVVEGYLVKLQPVGSSSKVRGIGRGRKEEREERKGEREVEGGGGRGRWIAKCRKSECVC